MGLPLRHVTELLEQIAPIRFAEDWDNVGLLLEPPDPGSPDGARAGRVSRILLTIDLTEQVLNEAIGKAADMVVAYHPPIFKPLKRLGLDDGRQRMLLRAVRHGIAVYSPHTALDAAPGGVNDWLADGLGESERKPITLASELPRSEDCKVVIYCQAAQVDHVRSALFSRVGAGWRGNLSHDSFATTGAATGVINDVNNPQRVAADQLQQHQITKLELVCAGRSLATISEVLQGMSGANPPVWEVHPLSPRPKLGVGMGRMLRLKQPVQLPLLVERLKEHLGLHFVRLAASAQHKRGKQVERVAVCAGAGGSVFAGMLGPHVYITGEMRHHDILEKNQNGSSVIVCDHTNTERGYLPRLKDSIVRASGEEIEVLLSAHDRDPLEVV